MSFLIHKVINCGRIKTVFLSENNENDISNDCESDDGEVEDVEFYTPMHNTGKHILIFIQQ